LRMTIQLWWG